MTNPVALSNRGMFVALDGSSLGTLPVDARLALSALIADDGSAALAVRQGIFWDGGAAVITGTTDTGAGLMSYQIRACSYTFYLLGTVASGTVLGSITGNVKVTTTDAPGSNSRIDVIWLRHRVTSSDGGSDSVNTPILGVTQGTAAASPTVPAIPTGAYAIAQAVVTAGTTQTSTTTITQVHNWAATAGSPIAVRTQTERDALTDYAGMSVYRIDNQNWELSDGTVWRPVPFAEAWGTFTPPNQAAGNNSTFPITFPTGRFTQAPNVQLTVGATRLNGAALSVTTTGFTANLTNWTAATATGAPCFWHAVQMLSGNASG